MPIMVQNSQRLLCGECHMSYLAEFTPEIVQAALAGIEAAVARRSRPAVMRRLSAHSGSMSFPVLWCDAGYWMHFGRVPRRGHAEGEDRPWICCGLEHPDDLTTLQVAVEINPPESDTRQNAGLLVRDIRGNLFLAHKGDLRGGAANVSAEDFAAHYRGGAREPVIWPNGKEGAYFIIGPVGRPDIVDAIGLFVREAGRIRRLIHGGADAPPPPLAVQPLLDVLRGEYAGMIHVQREAARLSFPRRHGEVVNALAEQLLERDGIRLGDARIGGYGPDLYEIDPADATRMSRLYEVKTSVGSQSIFAAIGQLQAYGSFQQRPPEQVVVIPAEQLAEPLRQVLARLGIRVVEYLFQRNRVVFQGL